MAQKVFELIRETDGVVLLSITANTEYSGASIRMFDQWEDPAHLDRFAQTLSEAAFWLRENGVN